MTAEASKRPQTAKQAKAAFKQRGAAHVSEAERKRLERGAELLRRAEKIRVQDAKKRVWQGQQQQSKPAPKQIKGHHLGSQRRLDKFGYASSQFHLGKFFKSAGADSRDCEEDGTATVQDQEHHEDEQHPASSDTEPSSPVDMDQFLDSSTQIARDLTASPSEPPPVRLSSSTTKEVTFPSFSSDFDDETIAQLDGAVEELRRSQSSVKQEPLLSEKLLWTRRDFLPPQLPPVSHARQSSTATKFEVNTEGCQSSLAKQMLPPPLPRAPCMTTRQLAGKSSISATRRPQTLHPPTSLIPVKRSPPSPLTSTRYTSKIADVSRYGISVTDLEDLAADDVVLTQRL